MTKKIFLLGSTGSIGVNTLDVVRSLNKAKGGDRYQCVGLAAGNDDKTLAEQIALHKPKTAYIQNEEGYARLKKKFPKLKLFTGPNGLAGSLEISGLNFCVNALVGSAGLEPTLKAVDLGATVALANKETLIMAGDAVLRRIQKKKVDLIPIDSEHSAIFHILKGIRKHECHRLILTASGGPFRDKTVDNPSVEETLAHPTWKMGRKISVDSATMMNKGFEVIEAHYLFGIPFKQIETIIHPQSIVHSMVETIDGEVYAQLGRNDMRHPIQNALTHPALAATPLPRFRLEDIQALTFFPMDFEKFPMLRLAYEAGEKGGTALTALNAANEACVGLFLSRKIGYRDIHRLTRAAVENHSFKKNPSVPEILALDGEIKGKLKSDFT